MSGGMGGGQEGVPDDLLTTKGDTHGFDTSNARVGIGADSTVLTADSTEALGLKWAASAAGYLAPTLGTTSIGSGATVPTLNALSLTDAGDLSLNIASELILKAGGLDNKIYTRGGSTVGNNSITFQAGGTDLVEINGSNNYLWLANDTALTLGGTRGLKTEASIMYKTADDSLEFRSPNSVQRMNLTTTGVDILGALTVDGVAVGGAPAWNRIINQSQPGGSSNFNVTGLTSTAKFMMFSFAGSFGGNDQLRIRFGTGGSIDTGTSYKWVTGTNGSYQSSTGDTFIQINSGNFETNRNFFLSGFMQWNATEDGSGTANTRIGNFETTGLANGFQKFTTGFEYLESTTPITDVRFYGNTGHDLRGTLNMWESQ